MSGSRRSVASEASGSLVDVGVYVPSATQSSSPAVSSHVLAAINASSRLGVAFTQLVPSSAPVASMSTWMRSSPT